MITPMKRLSVKKDPKMMKKTKYKYMYKFTSFMGCRPTYTQRSEVMKL